MATTKPKTLYKFNGAILRFGRVIDPRWKGSTFAVSESKARSNLVYQAKKQLGICQSAHIELDGKVIPA